MARMREEERGRERSSRDKSNKTEEARIAREDSKTPPPRDQTRSYRKPEPKSTTKLRQRAEGTEEILEALSRQGEIETRIAP